MIDFAIQFLNAEQTFSILTAECIDDSKRYAE